MGGRVSEWTGDRPTTKELGRSPQHLPSRGYLRLMEKEDRNVLISAGLSVVTAPVAAGVMAWVWKFPIVMVGNSGGTVDGAISAAFSMLLFMTVFSFFIGIVVIGLAGAGVSVLVRRGPVLDAVAAGVAVGVLAALVVGFGGVIFD